MLQSSPKSRAEALAHIALLLGKTTEAAQPEFRKAALHDPGWAYRQIRDYPLSDPAAYLSFKQGDRVQERMGQSDTELLQLAFKMSGLPENLAPTKDEFARFAEVIQESVQNLKDNLAKLQKDETGKAMNRAGMLTLDEEYVCSRLGICPSAFLETKARCRT